MSQRVAEYDDPVDALTSHLRQCVCESSRIIMNVR